MKVLPKIEVTTGNKLAGVVDINQYDSIAEAVQNLGEPTVLELINVQYKTRVMNQLRTSSGGNISTKDLKNKVLVLLFKDPVKMAAMEESVAAARLASAGQSEEAINAAAEAATARFIDAEVSALRATYKARVASLPDASPNGDDDDRAQS